MSAEVYGLGPGEFLPGNDFTARQTDKGGWTATQSFRFLRSSLSDSAFRNKFSFGVRATDLDENLDGYWARLYLEKTDVRNEGPWGVITVYYAGYAGFETDSGGTVTQPTSPIYRLTGTTREVSIVEHPTVRGLGDEDRFLIGEIARGEFLWDYDASELKMRGTDFSADVSEWLPTNPQPTAGDAVDWAKLVTDGWLTYREQSFMWEKLWESEQGIATSTINNLGKVDTPEGSPPTPTGSRNWILTDATQEKKGELYRNRLVWELSPKDGWEELVYDY